MMPEYLFFDQAVLAALESANNVAALVVYTGESPLLEGNLLPNESYPYPPLEAYSDDLKEPNARSNFYFTTSSSSDSSGSVNAGLIEFAAARSLQRNFLGVGSNFNFFPFNIFHVSGETATLIRNESRRFRDELIVVGSDSSLLRSRARTAPRYKLRSIGEMYACRSTPPPSDNETQEGDNSSPTATVNPITLVTSQMCLDNKSCLPVGSHSVWSSLTEVTNATTKVLAIASPIDSMAFFPDLAFGASAEVSSLAVLMAVSETVSAYYRERKRTADPFSMMTLPIFFAWNSQSWGYAGSSRFLQDLNDFRNCSLGQGNSTVCAQLEQLEERSPKLPHLQDADFTFLNIGQLISPFWWKNVTKEGDISVTYKLHHSNFECASSKISNPDTECSVVGDGSDQSLSRALATSFNNRNLWPSNVTVSFEDVMDVPEFPPDATHSIFRYRQNSTAFSLTSYRTFFNSSFYHSIYDNKSLTAYPEFANVTQRLSGRAPLYIAAQAITDAIISYIFDDPTASQPVNNSHIDDIIHCLTTDNWTSCRLGNEYNTTTTPPVSDGDVKGGNHAGSFFEWDRSVTASVSMAVKIDFIRNFLAYHNRYDNVDSLDELNDCDKSSDCDSYREQLNDAERFHSVHCIRKKCIVSDTYLHDAFGTGIDATNPGRTEFAFSETGDTSLTNPQNGAWTESVWDKNLSLCAAVEDTTLYGGLVLVAGIAVFVLSLIFTLTFDRYMTKNMHSDEDEIHALTRPVQALPQALP